VAFLHLGWIHSGGESLEFLPIAYDRVVCIDVGDLERPHCTVAVVFHVASRSESDRAEEPSALAPMRVDALFQ
jgi:hypothetical protein